MCRVVFSAFSHACHRRQIFNFLFTSEHFLQVCARIFMQLCKYFYANVIKSTLFSSFCKVDDKVYNLQFTKEITLAIHLITNNFARWNICINISKSKLSVRTIVYFAISYSETPPYSQFVITANIFCPDKTTIHFLIRKPR